MAGSTLQKVCVTAAKIPVYKVADSVDIFVIGVEVQYALGVGDG
jgi:hypothetical protein